VSGGLNGIYDQGCIIVASSYSVDKPLPLPGTLDVKNIDPRTHKFVKTNFVQANKIIKLHQHGEIEHCRFDDNIC